MLYSILVVLFCFFKQKTAYEMRISDWSSDVCSSDLEAVTAAFLEKLFELVGDFGRAADDVRRNPAGKLLGNLAQGHLVAEVFHHHCDLTLKDRKSVV